MKLAFATATLALWALTAQATDLTRQAPFLANDGIDVQSYDLRLRVAKLDASDVDAHAVLVVKPLQDLRSIDLHIEVAAVQVRSIQEKNKALRFSLLRGPGVAKHHLSGDVLRIERVGGFTKGRNVEISIDYTLHVQSRMEGLFFRKNYYGEPVLSTRSWPYYGRYWLPANDHPSDTATFRLEAHVPADAQVASNGLLEGGNYLQGSGLDAEGLRIFRWSQATPIPTYGFNVAISHYDVSKKKAGQWPLVFFSPRNFSEQSAYQQSVDDGGEAAVFFSKAFGAYPYAKLGFVAAPHPFNMEHPSMITLVDAESSVHEVLHHWWGDTVHIAHWGELWISEGFTTYFTGLFDEERSGKNSACLAAKGRLNNPPDTDVLDVFNDVAYCKGAAAVADLRSRMAEAAGGLKQDESRAFFLAWARGLYTQYQFQQLGSADLISYLHKNLVADFKRAHHTITQTAADALIREWQAAWFEPSS